MNDMGSMPLFRTSRASRSEMCQASFSTARGLAISSARVSITLSVNARDPASATGGDNLANSARARSASGSRSRIPCSTASISEVRWSPQSTMSATSSGVIRARPARTPSRTLSIECVKRTTCSRPKSPADPLIVCAARNTAWTPSSLVPFRSISNRAFSISERSSLDSCTSVARAAAMSIFGPFISRGRIRRRSPPVRGA
jgi:hypothetical protein